MATKNSKPLGYILHETSEIVVIATGFSAASKNRKTGKMIQIYILVKDQTPMSAVMNGADEKICGDCKHRRTLRFNPKSKKMEWVRTCYVNVGKGVTMVYDAWTRGRYAKIENGDFSMFADRNVRFGAYGDTCHIPEFVYRAICAIAASWTGYTHQWTNPENAWLSKYVMASCDNHTEMENAVALGWRYFRVTVKKSSAVNTSEILCPSSDEAKKARVARGNDKAISCASCGLCNGANTRKNIFIPVHGPSAKKAELFNVIQ